MKKPKILITCIHWPVASGRYMSSALRRMGYDVKTCGPEAHGHIWGMQVPGKYIWQPDIGMGVNVLDARIEYVLKRLDGWQPNLVINMDSAFDVVGEREEYPCPKVLYGVDGHVRDYNRNRLNWYDKRFLSHYNGPACPVSEEVGDVWLPVGYDDLAFPQSPIPFENREHDICMVGYPYGRRQVLVEKMQAAGLKVFSALGLLYDEFRDAYWNSKISLCVSALNDVGQRLFESSALGCAILTDPLPDLRRLGAISGRDYIEYGDDNDAIVKAKDLLAYPARLQDIAHYGHKFFANGTWQARAQVILDTMNMV